MWLVAATGVILASHDRDLGHDFNTKQGVFCSPSLAIAEQYARPCKPFPDGLYHRLVYELWVEPGKRVKRKNGHTVQWIVPQNAVRLKALWLRIDAPPEEFVEGWSVWKPFLEAKPTDATGPDIVNVSDLPCIDSFRSAEIAGNPDDVVGISPGLGSETEDSSSATSSESETEERPQTPRPKAMPRPQTPRPKAMPRRRIPHTLTENSGRSLDFEEKPKTPRPKAMPKQKLSTTLAKAPGPQQTSEVRRLGPAQEGSSTQHACFLFLASSVLASH